MCFPIRSPHRPGLCLDCGWRGEQSAGVLSAGGGPLKGRGEGAEQPLTFIPLMYLLSKSSSSGGGVRGDRGGPGVSPDQSMSASL